jgi:glycine C-acetyltransferase
MRMANVLELVTKELEQLVQSNTYKYEVPLQSAQDGIVRVGGRKAVMLASNNYLGLSNHPAVRGAAIRGIREYGYGVASVRFICGTQDIHLAWKRRSRSSWGRRTRYCFPRAGPPTRRSSPR